MCVEVVRSLVNDMGDLNQNWKPGFGTVYTWFAMDKYGRLAMMVNNCFGDLPRQLLMMEKAEDFLDGMNEFVWGESAEFGVCPKDKCGDFEVDLYSASAWRKRASKEEVFESLLNELKRRGQFADANIPKNRGFYVYHGVEGSYPGEDYPVGYDGCTEVGDYFRFLMPSVLGGIEDFPEELRKGVAVSADVDFSIDRVLSGRDINKYFSGLYC
ncbi:hypothetical protein TUM20249_18410 [Pseudomonas tohonis]|nr:hypothetical protein TUM20249_18410 [Pseudomonas tohonis]